MAINRFENLPQSFHHKRIWKDSFCCLVKSDNPIIENFSLDSYLKAAALWLTPKEEDPQIVVPMLSVFIRQAQNQDL